jgi:thiol-disulfide isomerase/thioredoxin
MLLEFYGLEDPICAKMVPLLERLEKEEGIKIVRYEVWHNEENAKMLESYDVGICGLVPFFINSENSSFLCGEITYDELKKWALQNLPNKSKVKRKSEKLIA